jgi:hypothetical protein
MAQVQMARAKLFRALHAEASKRGMDHDGLRDACRERYSVHSMGDLSDAQLEALYRGWTGHGLKRKSPLPKRGYARGQDVEMVSAEDIDLLGRAFAARGWGKETQTAFIRRQLNGRAEIRTRRDFWRVFSGVRAMNRRDPQAKACATEGR